MRLGSSNAFLTILDWGAGQCLKLFAMTFYGAAWRLLRAQLLRYTRVYGRPEEAIAEEMVQVVLVLAEDQRFFEHYGVDTKAILRVVLKGIRTGKWSGGSTITQQLVRVVTQRYERTLGRKLRELALASLVDANFAKEFQLSCYLHLAYFGWRMNGLSQACKRLNIRLPCSIEQATQIVARLKYPEPRIASEDLGKRIAWRAEHLRLLARSQDLEGG